MDVSLLEQSKYRAVHLKHDLKIFCAATTFFRNIWKFGSSKRMLCKPAVL